MGGGGANISIVTFKRVGATLSLDLCLSAVTQAPGPVAVSRHGRDLAPPPPLLKFPCPPWTTTLDLKS